MTSHFTGTTKNRRLSHGKQRLKRWVFRRLRKTGSKGAEGVVLPYSGYVVRGTRTVYVVRIIFEVLP